MRKILFLSILIGLTGCANLNVSTNTQNFSAPDGITKNDSIFIEPIRNDKYQELKGCTGAAACCWAWAQIGNRNGRTSRIRRMGDNRISSCAASAKRAVLSL